jgi:hypothetical protein
MSFIRLLVTLKMLNKFAIYWRILSGGSDNTTELNIDI